MKNFVTSIYRNWTELKCLGRKFLTIKHSKIKMESFPNLKKEKRTDLLEKYRWSVEQGQKKFDRSSSRILPRA